MRLWGACWSITQSLRSPMYTFILHLPFGRCGCFAELGMRTAWDTAWERKIPANEAPANDLTVLWLNTVLFLKLLWIVLLTAKIWKRYSLVIRAEMFNGAFIFFQAFTIEKSQPKGISGSQTTLPLTMANTKHPQSFCHGQKNPKPALYLKVHLLF